MKTGTAISGIFLVGMALLFGYGCGDDQDEIQRELDNLEFRLAVLDENGEEKSIFEGGEDIRLALMLNNKSGKDFLWEYSYWCQLFQQEDLFLVYRISRLEEGGVGQPGVVGRPYRFPTFCLAINLPPRSIPSGEQSVVSAFWSHNPDNLPLPSGRYFSEFSYTLNMDGRAKRLELRVDFSIG